MSVCHCTFETVNKWELWGNYFDFKIVFKGGEEFIASQTLHAYWAENSFKTKCMLIVLMYWGGASYVMSSLMSFTVCAL